MATRDFTANQIRTARLIMTGSSSKGGLAAPGNKLELAVYSESVAPNSKGGNPAPLPWQDAGPDTTIFVSGSQTARGGNKGGVTLFEGDVYVSGSLVVENAGRAPRASISGSIQQTATGHSYLNAGSGIVITSGSANGGQVTISSTGAALAFKTIAVAGQDDVVADSNTDTVTFVAGSNMTITTGVDDTVTFNASDSVLTSEAVQDIVGAMFSGNTETNITVEYKDEDGTIDLTATDTNTMGSGFTVSATTDTNDTTITEGDDLFFAAGTGITCETTADGTVTITNTVTNTDTQLTQEQVEDIAGPLVATGGTKTGITVTYEDSTGDMDFVVSNVGFSSDSGTVDITPGGTALTVAGGTNVTTGITGNTLTINSTATGGDTLVYGEGGPYSFWPSGSLKAFKDSSQDAAVDRFGVIQGISHARVLYADAGTGADSLVGSSLFDVADSAVGERCTSLCMRTIIPDNITPSATAKVTIELGYSAINTDTLHLDIGGAGQKRILNRIGIGNLGSDGSNGMRYSQTASPLTINITALKTDVANNPSRYVAAQTHSGGQNVTIHGSATTYSYSINATDTLNGDTDALAAIAALPNSLVFAPVAVAGDYGGSGGAYNLNANGNTHNVFVFDVNGTGSSNTSSNREVTAQNLRDAINASPLGILVKAIHTSNGDDDFVTLEFDGGTDLSHGVMEGAAVTTTSASSSGNREWRIANGDMATGTVTHSSSQTGITSPAGGFVSLYLAGRVIKNGRNAARGTNGNNDSAPGNWLGGSGSNRSVGLSSTINTKEFKGPQNSGWCGFTADTTSGVDSNRLTGASINDSNYRTVTSRSITIDKLINDANRSGATQALDRYAAGDILDIALAIDNNGFIDVESTTTNPASVNHKVAIVVHYAKIEFANS